MTFGVVWVIGESFLCFLAFDLVNMGAIFCVLEAFLLVFSYVDVCVDVSLSSSFWSSLVLFFRVLSNLFFLDFGLYLCCCDLMAELLVFIGWAPFIFLACSISSLSILSFLRTLVYRVSFLS